MLLKEVRDLQYLACLGGSFGGLFWLPFMVQKSSIEGKAYSAQ